MQILRGRTVPLGGLRALDVQRTLPHRDRSFIGAWCFVDYYGPTVVRRDGSGSMDVAPHPHTGLQTVSWLFEGEIEHRDTGGKHAIVRPGEVNLMTSGAGIAHSEVSTPETTSLHGVQLWVALPDSDRHTARGFENYAAPAVRLPGGGGSARVFIGELAGVGTSPVGVFSPLLGAELRLDPGCRCTLPVDGSFEHGVLAASGDLTVNGEVLALGDLACLDAGATALTLEAGEQPVIALLVGGAPFEEEIVMWWNFVGRTHEEIVAFREAWQAGSETFGTVQGYVGEIDRIPAPAIPGVRLRPRNRHGRVDTRSVRS